MATYIEDLVQNIYTNCDMSGLDKLNKGLQEAIMYSGVLESNLRKANMAQREGFNFHARAIDRSKEAYQIERQRQSLEYQQARYRNKLAEQEEIIDNRRKRRQDAENKRLSRRNWLQRNFVRIAAGYIGLRTFKNIFDTGSRLQLVQKSIEGLTKSTQDWKYVQEQAFRTGTDIEVVAKGYRNFYSSANMAGFGKGQIQGMYADVLLSTRAIGANTQQTEGALLALEQMISKGRVSMEELRRQLGNAIPGAFEIGAKAMNMTTKEFNDFVKTGQLASTVFVPLFIKALKEAYADGFKDIEQTVSVANVRLINAWKELTSEIISGETGKALAQGINALREILIRPELKELIKVLGKISLLLIKIIDFAIRFLPMILLYLGYSKITGALVSLFQWLAKIQLLVFSISGKVLTFGMVGKAAFAAMGTGALALAKSLLPVLMTLMAIEDIIFFLGEQFLGWNTRSAIGEAVKAVNGQNGNMSLSEQMQDRIQKWRNEQDFAGQYYKKGSKGYKQLKRALEEGDVEAIKQLVPKETVAPLGGYGSLSKQEINNTNVTIGDINIKTNSDNPQQVGETVAQALIDLFASLGITENAKTAIV